MYKISNELREALINYLGNAPAKEVINMILALSNAEEINEESQNSNNK